MRMIVTLGAGSLLVAGCVAPAASRSPNAAGGGTPDTVGGPPVTAYLLALDAAIVHMGPRTGPIAVYPPPGVHLPPAALRERDVHVTSRAAPCDAKEPVIELLPARRADRPGWELESITRPVHQITFGDVSRIRCAGEVCATQYTMPVNREELRASCSSQEFGSQADTGRRGDRD